MSEQRIIVGGGGHALSVADAAKALGHQVLGCVAPRSTADTASLLPWLGGEDRLQAAEFRRILLLNGIGSAGPIDNRRAVYRRLVEAGHRFAPLIHPRASLSALGVGLGDACQVLAGAIINAAAQIGDNVLINTAAVVEHGCVIGSHSHVASGATLCGECRLGEAVHIGAGATVIQGISIGAGAVIAAGAVVTRNVEPLTLVGGVPARKLRNIDE